MTMTLFQKMKKLGNFPILWNNTETTMTLYWKVLRNSIEQETQLPTCRVGQKNSFVTENYYISFGMLQRQP